MSSLPCKPCKVLPVVPWSSPFAMLCGTLCCARRAGRLLPESVDRWELCRARSAWSFYFSSKKRRWTVGEFQSIAKSSRIRPVEYWSILKPMVTWGIPIWGHIHLVWGMGLWWRYWLTSWKCWEIPCGGQELGFNSLVSAKAQTTWWAGGFSEIWSRIWYALYLQSKFGLLHTLFPPRLKSKSSQRWHCSAEF